MKSLNARVTFATMTAVALAGFATSEAQADDVSAEIRLLRARLNGLEPLKERLKRLEAQVAKQNRQRKQAKTQNGETRRSPNPRRSHSLPICRTASRLNRLTTPAA